MKSGWKVAAALAVVAGVGLRAWSDDNLGAKKKEECKACPDDKAAAKAGKADPCEKGGVCENGKSVCVKGTIVDLSCYLKKGDEGKDAACAKECLSKGAPAGLVAECGTVVLLISKTCLADQAGKTVAVKGTCLSRGGFKALAVEEVCAAEAKSEAKADAKADVKVGAAAAVADPHACCKEAKAAGKDCEKCKGGAAKAAAPAFKSGSCCDKASVSGGACSHPCCAKAAGEGKVCAKCNS